MNALRGNRTHTFTIKPDGMPSTRHKRKADASSGNENKKAKPNVSKESKDRVKLAPLGQRDINRAPAGWHNRKKNGDCRKDCRICKSEKFDWEALNNPEHVFHKFYVCRAKGRDGSPTIDQAGYELDYDKVMGWFKPTSVASLRPTPSKMKKFDEHVEKKRREEQQVLDIFFEGGAAPDVNASDFPSFTIDVIKERVEKDIGVPWHKIGSQEVREWEQKGFTKARKGEYQDFSSEDRKRFLDLHEGCVFRK